MDRIRCTSSRKMRARGNAAGSPVEAEGTMTLSESEFKVTELCWKTHVQIMGRITSLNMRFLPA